MEAVGFSGQLPLAASAGVDGKLLVWDCGTMTQRSSCEHPEVRHGRMVCPAGWAGACMGWPAGVRWGVWVRGGGGGAGGTLAGQPLQRRGAAFDALAAARAHVHSALVGAIAHRTQQNPKLLPLAHHPPGPACPRRLLVQSLTRMAWHPTQPLVFTACLDGAARCWDLRTAACVRTYGGHEAAIQVRPPVCLLWPRLCGGSLCMLGAAAQGT